MKIYQPEFKDGKHQFADQINNYYTNTTEEALFWDLIPRHLLTKEELEALIKHYKLWLQTSHEELDWKHAIINIINVLYGKITPDKASILNDLLFEDDEKEPIQFDAFLSFCEEDAAIALKLYEELVKHGLKVWFSRVKLNVGDSIVGVINKAIQNSRVGIAIISNHTFEDSKHFPLLELNALLNREMYDNLLMLPVYHNISHEYVLKKSALIADKFATETKMGIKKAAMDIVAAIKNT
ncbi:MAG: toll/interleukin-1 receptor domain-containing protein [Chitinophagales bacterium]|nr:toll/interleukin-1 receptor domain-containing protein [Chitinophagales bacterium]